MVDFLQDNFSSTWFLFSLRLPFFYSHLIIVFRLLNVRTLHIHFKIWIHGMRAAYLTKLRLLWWKVIRRLRRY